MSHNFMEEVKGYSDSREEEEDEEAAEIIAITTREEEEEEETNNRLRQQDEAPSFINHHRKQQQQQQLDFMDLSLGSNKADGPNFQQGPSSSTQQHQYSSHGHAGSSSTSNNEAPVEKEHMFDKVVTPSDVGKLNRLVIPKQHAEKYFPLDSSSNEKGLLLNFEDRNGKLWRFRYSYWNSSQSYVMTKGWSRFVKEKKLDAGDIVSFQRGLGDLYRHRLFIDWRRRPDHPSDHPSASLITPLFLPNHYSIRWGGRLYSLPSPQASSNVPRHHDHFHQQLNYNHMYAFQHQQQHHQHQHQHQHQYHVGGSHFSSFGDMNSGSGSVYYLRSTPSMSMVDQNLAGQQQERGTIAPMIIDSVPVAHHHHHHHGGTGNKSGGVVATSSGSNNTAGKRLRLFGVNMECASSSSNSAEESNCLMSSASAAHVTMTKSLPSSSLQRSSSSSARFGDQRGETSVLFDLDPTLQYRQ